MDKAPSLLSDKVKPCPLCKAPNRTIRKRRGKYITTDVQPQWVSVESLRERLIEIGNSDDWLHIGIGSETQQAVRNALFRVIEFIDEKTQEGER